MDKMIIFNCPCGRINTEERYLWCNNEEKECQNVGWCKFKGKMQLIMSSLQESDKRKVIDEMGIERINNGRKVYNN